MPTPVTASAVKTFRDDPKKFDLAKPKNKNESLKNCISGINALNDNEKKVLLIKVVNYIFSGEKIENKNFSVLNDDFKKNIEFLVANESHVFPQVITRGAFFLLAYLSYSIEVAKYKKNNDSDVGLDFKNIKAVMGKAMYNLSIDDKYKTQILAVFNAKYTNYSKEIQISFQKGKFYQPTEGPLNYEDKFGVRFLIDSSGYSVNHTFYTTVNKTDEGCAGGDDGSPRPSRHSGSFRTSTLSTVTVDYAQLDSEKKGLESDPFIKNILSALVANNDSIEELLAQANPADLVNLQRWVCIWKNLSKENPTSKQLELLEKNIEAIELINDLTKAQNTNSIVEYIGLKLIPFENDFINNIVNLVKQLIQLNFHITNKTLMLKLLSVIGEDIEIDGDDGRNNKKRNIRKIISEIAYDYLSLTNNAITSEEFNKLFDTMSNCYDKDSDQQKIIINFKNLYSNITNTPAFILCRELILSIEDKDPLKKKFTQLIISYETIQKLLIDYDISNENLFKKIKEAIGNNTPDENIKSHLKIFMPSVIDKLIEDFSKADDSEKEKIIKHIQNLKSLFNSDPIFQQEFLINILDKFKDNLIVTLIEGNKFDHLNQLKLLFVGHEELQQQFSTQILLILDQNNTIKTFIKEDKLEHLQSLKKLFSADDGVKETFLTNCLEAFTNHINSKRDTDKAFDVLNFQRFKALFSGTQKEKVFLSSVLRNIVETNRVDDLINRNKFNVLNELKDLFSEDRVLQAQLLDYIMKIISKNDIIQGLLVNKNNSSTLEDSSIHHLDQLKSVFSGHETHLQRFLDGVIHVLIEKDTIKELLTDKNNFNTLEQLKKIFPADANQKRTLLIMISTQLYNLLKNIVDQDLGEAQTVLEIIQKIDAFIGLIDDQEIINNLKLKITNSLFVSNPGRIENYSEVLKHIKNWSL